ncbi:MAG: hypothetical protein ACK5V2_13965 [Pseudomonadota bacterium]|jgi:hypothetical protein
MSMTSSLIPDRCEFIDALRALRNGRVLVQGGEGSNSFVLDGALLHTAHRPLVHYGLVHEFDNPAGFRGARYYRLSANGREFADRADEAWRRRPWLERMAVRLTG